MQLLKQIALSGLVSDYEKTGKNKGIKKWISLTTDKPDANYVNSDEWQKNDGGDHYFFDLKTMHPSVKYDFQAEIFRSIVLDDTKIAALKETLSNLNIKFLKATGKTGWSNSDRNKLNSNLDKASNKLSVLQASPRSDSKPQQAKRFF